MGGASADLLTAVSAQKRNDMPAAIQHYEAAIHSGERTGVAANNLAWLYAERGGSLDRALDLAQQARDLSPSNAAFLDTLGYVHLRRREYSEALNTLKKAVELSTGEGAPRGDSIRFRRHLAQAYRLAGQPDEAEKIRVQ
jgi:tetratricopeptide (TPR) repeat protein